MKKCRGGIGGLFTNTKHTTRYIGRAPVSKLFTYSEKCDYISVKLAIQFPSIRVIWVNDVITIIFVDFDQSFKEKVGEFRVH
jgi:hypothetical protein